MIQNGKTMSQTPATTTLLRLTSLTHNTPLARRKREVVSIINLRRVRRKGERKKRSSKDDFFKHGSSADALDWWLPEIII